MSTTERRQPKIRTKPCRKDLANHENLCAHCAAKCCRYFALAIDEPSDWDDFELIRWFLLHQRASVFTEDGEWYLLVHNKCEALREDNLCGAYETRPKICRDYTTDKCEYEDEWVYDHYFETPEQVTEYAEALLGPRDHGDARGSTLRKTEIRAREPSPCGRCPASCSPIPNPQSPTPTP